MDVRGSSASARAACRRAPVRPVTDLRRGERATLTDADLCSAISLPPSPGCKMSLNKPQAEKVDDRGRFRPRSRSDAHRLVCPRDHQRGRARAFVSMPPSRASTIEVHHVAFGGAGPLHALLHRAQAQASPSWSSSPLGVGCMSHLCCSRSQLSFLNLEIHIVRLRDLSKAGFFSPS